MGATTFICEATGKDMADAFRNAVSQSGHEHGYSYSGTISVKSEYRELTRYLGINRERATTIRKIVNEIMSAEEVWDDAAGEVRYPGLEKKYIPATLAILKKTVFDKWGPAGALRLEKGRYIFFGWASS